MVGLRTADGYLTEVPSNHPLVAELQVQAEVVLDGVEVSVPGTKSQLEELLVSSEALLSSSPVDAVGAYDYMVGVLALQRLFRKKPEFECFVRRRSGTLQKTWRGKVADWVVPSQVWTVDFFCYPLEARLRETRRKWGLDGGRASPLEVKWEPPLEDTGAMAEAVFHDSSSTLYVRVTRRNGHCLLFSRTLPKKNDPPVEVTILLVTGDFVVAFWLSGSSGGRLHRVDLPASCLNVPLAEAVVEELAPSRLRRALRLEEADKLLRALAQNTPAEADSYVLL